MRRTLNNVISVAFSAVRMIWFKIMGGSNFKGSLIQRFSPNVVLEFNKGSKISLGRQIRIHSGSKIKVRSGAKLYIGDKVKINYNCLIICHDNIKIGEGTEFGPSVYVYDHDHDFRVEGGLKADKFKYSPVTIGKKCWIGANTIILRGTTIGDNSVIAAGSIVNGDVPSNSLFVQRRTSEIKKVD